MNKESIVAIIRIVAPLVVSVLGAAGVALDVDTVTCVMVIVAGGVVAVYTGWKSNNVTLAAQKAYEYFLVLKNDNSVGIIEDVEGE